MAQHDLSAGQFGGNASPYSRGEVVMSLSFYPRLGKRLIDTALAAIFLAVAWPVLAVSAIAVWLDAGSPVLFRQARVGQYGKTFIIYKFRTMRLCQGPKGPSITAAGDPRITQSGNWLRKTKIDELPQLFNVLRGDMSLVGPRPEVPEYVAAYSTAEKDVLLLKPGMTGAAALSFMEEEKLLAKVKEKETFYVTKLMPMKLEQDLGYCRNICFTEDLKLLLRTLARLVRRT